MAEKVNTEGLKNKLQEKKEQSMTPQEGFQNIITRQLTSQFKAIESLVPKHMTPERICRLGLNAISRNPKLMECDPATVVGAIVNCATLGLEPNLLGHAYIVPFWNSKTKRMEAQFQIGYKGALDLIRRTGAVSTISAHEVYQGDVFEYEYGLDEKLKHIPQGENNESMITHFYACYKLKDGGSGFVVMSKESMDEHRDRFTKSKDKSGKVFGPWADHYVSMALKTVILRLVKYMPISIEQENQTILEGIGRDNTTAEIKQPQQSVGFGDAFIDTQYVVVDQEESEMPEEE